jgi:signal transduction histidine kinase
LLLVIGTLFSEDTSDIILKMASFYAGGMSLLFIAVPVHFYSALIYLVEIVALLTGFYGIACLSFAFVRGRKGAFLLLAGGLQLAAAGIHDLLYQNNVVLSAFGDFIPFGLLILLSIQSFVLSQRFSQAFEDVSVLSRKLLKLDKIKDEFLANTSHELRTPLSGIIGITEAMLKGSGGGLSGSQRQDLSMIAGSSRRLANLVNDILDYSRMKSGDILLNLQPVQIGGSIHTVSKVFQNLSQSTDYEVLTDIPENLPSALVDENRMVQILYNLIGNAAKFTVQGHIMISARKAGNMVEVCVSDTGEGIPEDRLEDIFQSFEQVDTSLTRRHGGTGLGLPITKYLVEQQGGSIWVESHPGKGSRFYFTVPVSDVAPAEPEDLQEESKQDMTEQEVAVSLDNVTAIMEAHEEGAPVLLVDDDLLSLQAATAILRLAGYRITTASNGKTALAKLKERPDYSLVILDIMMPEMSGYEVCRTIRESWSVFELPVLMLTAKATKEDIVQGFDAGANDYLAKPFEPEELLARVGTLAGLKDSVEKSVSAELAFLQAQIKPHFLYNVLTAVSSLCGSNPARAQELIVNFSEYLRYSFDFKEFDAFSPLERELNLVKAYTEVEKARFGDQLSVEFDLDSTVNIQIPILTIQPLVENAINHGFRKKVGGGTVRISVKKEPEGVLVAIADDGLGIPKERLQNLLTPNSGHGIGLWNIDGRLKKLFGKGITIESTPGEGTRVAYIVPSVGGDLK